MNNFFPYRQRLDPDGHLGPALLLAIALHAWVIFAVGFKWQNSTVKSPSIEVTLSHHSSTEKPKKADYIAQHDQQGSGSIEQLREITNNERALLEGNKLQDVAPLLPAPQPAQSSPQDKTPSPIARTGTVIASQPLPQDNVQNLTPSPLIKQAREIASLRARLDLQKQAYSRIPRTLVLTSASTRASPQANYLRQWIEWVETIGNQNYPEEARRKHIFGDLRLVVTLQRDGSVNIDGIKILHSSGQRVLDQAAIRIVRLAAPFAAIPNTIPEDQVEVIRTWRFIPGNKLATTSHN